MPRNERRRVVSAVSSADLLRAVAVNPELIAGFRLGEVLLPEPLRVRGQWVVRSDDLLSFRLELTNLSVVARAADDTTHGVLKVAGRGAAYLALHFAPQSILERAFFAQDKQNDNLDEVDGHVDPSKPVPPKPPPTPQEPLVPPPVASRIAYPTRLVFAFSEEKLRAAGYWPVDYTLQGILRACAILNPNVASNARDWARPRWPRELDAFDGGRVREVAKAFNALSLAQKAAVAAAARRNEQLIARAGVEASAVLMRRAELPVMGPEPAFDVMTQVLPAREAARAGVKTPTRVVLPLPLTPAGIALRTSLAALGPHRGFGDALLRLPRPRKPSRTETSIELPFRLVVSPGVDARFTHDLQPAASAATGHTGLWHTRLAPASEADTGIHARLAQPIRAIWARGGPESDPSKFIDHWSAVPGALAIGDNQPFRASLDDRDRYNIVHLSGNFQLAGGWHEPIDCRRLMLSTLGGWLEARGEWHVPKGLSVEQWVHQAAQARDHYVRVVYKGFLLPFGHRVSLVKETQRYFTQGPGNIAYLLQRMFIMVREPVRRYPETTLIGERDGKPMFYHRVLPFAQVRLITEVTPDLYLPEATKVVFTDPATGAGGLAQMYFWPALDATTPFRFQYVATDLDGNEIAFDLPGIFIDNQYANPITSGSVTSATYYQFGANDWASDARSAWRRAKLRNQKVALAPSSKPGDTASEIDEFEFGAETKGVEHIESPKLRPTIRTAQVRIPAVGALSGATGTNPLEYESGFFGLASGYEAGEVYAKLTGGQGLDFTSCGNRSGGFVQPNLAPSGLSRLKGPVAGNLATAAAGEFSPGDFFAQLAPLLFGCIPLDKVIAAVGGKAPFGEMPNFVTEALQQGEALFASLGQLDRFDEVVLGPVRNAAEAVVRQAIGLSFADVQKQLAVLDANSALLAAQAGNVVTAATTVVTSLHGAAAAAFENPLQLQAAVQPVATALQTLGTALAARDGALAVPAADGLSAATIQMARQQIALVRARVLQVQTTLADFQRIPAVVTAAKDVLAKVSPVLVEPAELKTLLETNALGALFTALNASLAAFGTALRPLQLVEGALKKTLLGVVDTLGGVLADIATLVTILESLVGEEIVVRLNFAPTLQPFSLPGMPNLFKPHDPKAFFVGVEARIKKTGGAPSIQVRCALTHFDLNLLGEADAAFIRLEFERIEFIAEPDGKTRVDVGFSGIHFIGVLSFVEALRDLIPLDGFSDPPGLTVDENGIDAQFSVALPNLAIGVMSLTNLSLGAGFTVPFIGQPLSVRFNFCTREAPFNLTVTLFGGGGFFGITIDPHGVQILEAAFEFGAAIAIDFGVASGGVHVMAGIYFRMEPSKASLTGYFRLGGYVDVLGLISASIELYLDLVYVFDEGKCVGHASLTIEVHVLFFSGSVSVSCERKFAGSSGDPSFAALVGPADGSVPDAATLYPWRQYCEAFA